MKTYKDYPAEKIAEQLEKVNKFKAEHPHLANLTKIRAWEKWCTDPEYRKREWQFRQAVAASIKPNVNYLKDI